MFAGNLIESLDNVFAKYRAAVLANEIAADQVAAMIQGIAQVCRCSPNPEPAAVVNEPATVEVDETAVVEESPVVEEVQPVSIKKRRKSKKAEQLTEEAESVEEVSAVDADNGEG